MGAGLRHSVQTGKPNWGGVGSGMDKHFTQASVKAILSTAGKPA